MMTTMISTVESDDDGAVFAIGRRCLCNRNAWAECHGHAGSHIHRQAPQAEKHRGHAGSRVPNLPILVVCQVVCQELLIIRRLPAIEDTQPSECRNRQAENVRAAASAARRLPRQHLGHPLLHPLQHVILVLVPEAQHC